MGDTPQRPLEARIVEAQAAIEVVAEATPYQPELLLGAFATVNAIADEAFKEGAIGLDRRAEITIEAATRAARIAETKKDTATHSTMTLVLEQSKTILDFTKKPTKKTTTRKASPTAAQSSKPKK
jgi:hypothetical protein